MENEDTQYEIENPVNNENVIFENEIGAPPLVVVVQGGKGSGKSTLIKSLIKYYTNHTINEIKGSITIRNTKNQRITFYECINEISALVDLSKIADIAIVMIDASVGFEIETFEFLSLLKNHGFTSVMGVLTHMDEFKQNESLKKLKKKIKKRLHKEVTDKTKLFYLFGLKFNLYQKIQMHNLARYLRVIKPITPGFRQNHPYLLADRYDVVFPSNNIGPEDNVIVSFFGYIRGNNFSKNSNIHINGVGDFGVDFIQTIEDPCPIETVQIKGKKKKRTLKQKEKFLYAPYCNTNSLEYDRNSGYIVIPDKFVSFTKGLNEYSGVRMDDGVNMVRELQDLAEKNTINNQIGSSNNMEIFEGINYKEDENQKFDRKFEEDRQIKKKKELKEKEIENLKKNIDDFRSNVKNPSLYRELVTTDLNKIIYDETKENSLENEEIAESSKFQTNQNLDINFFLKHAKKFFMAGSDLFENGDGNSNINNIQQTVEQIEKEKEIESDDDSSEGGFKKKKKNNHDYQSNQEDVQNEEEQESRRKNVKKIVVKEENLIKPFCNEEYGIFEKGTYVRIDIKQIKRKFLDHFRIDYPIILCTTNIQETNFGFLKIKFSKHIWYPKILKTNDPIIFSIGWRKFQSIPVYCIEDRNHRLRMIKYTPKYRDCFAITYGPFLPINVAIVAIQKYTDDIKHFRICGTGDLMEVNQSFQVMKKLKLMGEPYEIYKKTSFIKGMFNSSLEVARYIGASLKTVSGIRGQIKKPLNKPDGAFRATFEDKLIKSDLVFLKTWYPVEVQKFYNPVYNYGEMRFLRTMAQLRNDYNIPLPINKDSEYKEVNREERIFPNLIISKTLEENLPFQSKNKVKTMMEGKSEKYVEDDTFLMKKHKLPTTKLKSVLTDKEKNAYSLLQRLHTIKNLKIKKAAIAKKNYVEKQKVEEQKQDKKQKLAIRNKMIKNIKKKGQN